MSEEDTNVDFCFRDRVVVITGASRGLGRSFAQRFAESGASLGLLSRDENALAELSAELPTKAIGIKCDVTDLKQVSAAFQIVAEKLGAVDIAIANAGGISTARRAEELPPSKWHEIIDLNLTGVYFTARSAYPYLSQSRAGRLLFVSSAAARFPISHMCAYAAAKSGIEGLVRALSVEWSGTGICVNAVSPGLIDTSGSMEIPDKLKRSTIARTTVRRAGTAAELRDVMLFLASENASYITGQVISVDGGLGLA